jgi:hypothetical protein
VLVLEQTIVNGRVSWYIASDYTDSIYYTAGHFGRAEGVGQKYTVREQKELATES